MDGFSVVIVLLMAVAAGLERGLPGLLSLCILLGLGRLVAAVLPPEGGDNSPRPKAHYHELGGQLLYTQLGSRVAAFAAAEFRRRQHSLRGVRPARDHRREIFERVYAERRALMYGAEEMLDKVADLISFEEAQV